MAKKHKPIITSGMEWTFDLIEEIFDHITRIAREKYDLDFYQNQLEVISSEQMLDAYCSAGLPVHYPHWSFGEDFIKQMEAYKRGHMGLAYEIVINSNPCIAYLMEENTMVLQTLVLCHASIGHNSFFKTNYLFKQWTDASSIIDYLIFAKKYIRDCEERYGTDQVEMVIDSAHALRQHGINKYKRPTRLSVEDEKRLQQVRDEYTQQNMNLIWKTIPTTRGKTFTTADPDKFPKEPEENLLYFFEKHAPRLKTWQREIIRIIRKISQYFYPQQQTHLMNEGYASFWHHTLFNDLYDEGLVDESAMLEFFTHHSNVIYQPDFDCRRYGGINVYALGFAMFKDIQRVATNPTEEDRKWFRGQKWVGSGDWLSVVKEAAVNFKNESFIQQYLSPKLIRDFRLFVVQDNDKKSMLEVTGIHDDQGYRTVREALSHHYDMGYSVPDIQVTDVNRWGDRTLILEHTMVNNRPLDIDSTLETLEHIRYLWGYGVVLKSLTQQRKLTAMFDKNANTKVSLDLFLDDDE